MRLVVPKPSLRRVLKWTQGLLFACAMLLLGYCGFVLVDAWIFQSRESRGLDRVLRERTTAPEAILHPERKPSLRGDPQPVPEGLTGRIEIPRLGLSVVVADSIDEPTLRRAPGHIL